MYFLVLGNSVSSHLYAHFEEVMTLILLTWATWRYFFFRSLKWFLNFRLVFTLWNGDNGELLLCVIWTLTLLFHTRLSFFPFCLGRKERTPQGSQSSNGLSDFRTLSRYLSDRRDHVWNGEGFSRRIAKFSGSNRKSILFARRTLVRTLLFCPVIV